MGKRNRETMEAWSMLPEELLEMILARLDLADHARFSSVCKNWRFIAVKNTAANKPLSLVRSAEPRCLIHRLLSSFWNTQRDQIKFVGSFEGWLILIIRFKVFPPKPGTLKKRYEMILLNPGSGEAPIHLQLIPEWAATVLKAVLSSSPAANCSIVFSDCPGALASCRLGDTTWTKLYSPPDRDNAILDIAFCKNQLYAIDRSGVVVVFDSGLSSPPTRCFQYPVLEPYLLSAYDKLLLIGITYPYNNDHQLVPSLRLDKVFEIDPSRNSSYFEMESLGDNILFLSSAGSISLPAARDNPEFILNHIYKLINTDGDKVFYACSMDDRTLLRFNTNTRERNLIFFTLFSTRGFRKKDAENNG